MKINIYTHLYDDANRNYDLSISDRIKVMLKIIDELNLKNKKILDIGCYDGTQLEMIKNKNNEFHGLEASDYGVRKCEEKGIKIKKYFFDDVEKLPYEDNYFDLVIGGEIIEHIYDTDFFLSEIRRVLKPNGNLLLSTPNIASLGRRIMLFLGISPIIEISPNEKNSSGHIRYFTFASLENILKKHGFAVIKKRSDMVNLSKNGNIKFSLLARCLPNIGTSLIILSSKR